MQQDCIFCRIAAGEIPCFMLYEDEFTAAFMDITPASPGHALALPKRHFPDLYQLPADLLAATAATAQKVAVAVSAALEPAGLNLVQANGPGAAQSVLHFHLHILPRGDRDGLRLNWGLQPGDVSQIEQIYERVRARLA